MRNEVIILERLDDCARCGQTHEGLSFWVLTRPVVDNDGTTWDAFAWCPTNGEPILLRLMPNTQPAKYGDPGELKSRC